MTRSRDDGGELATVTESTLGEAMRAPSTTVPEVVVLKSVDDDVKPKQPEDPKQDLWLSSVDGRHQSPIIPVRVGPHAETFFVHRAIITKSEYFRKALDGGFREAKEQAIDLPVEDPRLFSYVVAFLYEDKYVPIKPVSTILAVDTGKGKETTEDSGSENESDAGSASDASTRSRRLRERRRRRQEREWEARQRKQPGRHRPDCNCNTCRNELMTPPCWNCGIATRMPPPRNPRYRNHPPIPVPGVRPGPPNPRIRQRRRGSQQTGALDEPSQEPRMSPEDIRTWELAYALSVDVYVCAQRYLLKDLQTCIASCIIDNFEVAGVDAALPSVLESCKTLLDGLPNSDTLLKKVFARVGFLQALMWKNFPGETASFYAEYPDIAPLIMKEMVEKREEGGKAHDLPAMERSTPLFPIRSDEFIVNDFRGYREPIRY